jgi:hypothetical protein
LKNKILILLIVVSVPAFAQNPIIRDQFTADPAARVFNGMVYVYPSHDIPTPPQKPGRKDWFCMGDYHVFSSSNLTEWTDHGVIISQHNVAWVDSASYSMWAPDCIGKNGNYYFYFPSSPKASYGRGFSIGVAIAGNPAGPFISQPEPIKNLRGIDPNPFIDKDGQAYLYWAMGNIYAARLKDNMLELASEPQVIAEMPKEGLKEGPYLFERNGIYYMTYPHVQNKIERLEYATGNNPMGPFTYRGVIMDESPMNCWTNQQSFIEFNGQWYLFYHQDALSPKFDKNRSICIDSLFFNADGSIRKVTPTLRGVGVTPAVQQIEIDRYSRKSEKGTSVEFLDSANTFSGWKTIFRGKAAWIQYNSVDFGKKKLKLIRVKAFSKSGGTLQIRMDKPDGFLLSEVKIPQGKEWMMVNSRLSGYKKGIHNLVIMAGDANPVEIDWVRFEK